MSMSLFLMFGNADVLHYARNGVLVAFTVYLAFQVRKPSRWLGRPFVWIMNSSHSSLTDWGLEHVVTGKDFTILDVGCGGGRTIQKLAAMASNGNVFGIDYAAGSVAVASRKNADLVQEGRVEICAGSVSQLPYPSNTFDLVTAIETQYYWPNLVSDMKEIRRVLKPGATLLVINEVYDKGETISVEGMVMKLLQSKTLTVDGYLRSFSEAGFCEIRTDEHRKGWVCAFGRKPE